MRNYKNDPRIGELRYYKGKWAVRILQPSRVNWAVVAEEPLELNLHDSKVIVSTGFCFTTLPRLLWRARRAAHRVEEI